jgi:Zn-dependent M28 family amino/carboxypeptidase
MQVGEYDTLVDGKYQQRSVFQRYKFPIIAVVVLLAALAIVLAVVLSSRGKDKTWDQQINVDNIMGHLQQLQNIANENNGTRASSTPGYNASVAYIVSQLKEHTNYEVTVQEFNYSSLIILGGTNMTIFSTPQVELVYDTDFTIIGGGSQGAYNIENASVIAANGYGCDPSDYANVVPGSVAIVKRGNCTFNVKCAAGLSNKPLALIIYNEGDTPDRTGLYNVSLGNVNGLVLATSYPAGLELLKGATVSFSALTVLNYKYTYNVIADTRVGKADSIIVVGSHLDSVPAGPGINDNGSGSALNIELAKQLASSDNQKKIKNKIRFCWFGAEELGLLGSYAYVLNLNHTNPAALKDIAVNLNFDMIGSPNFIRGVYNGSSDTHNGSHVVQLLFNKYFASQNLAVIPTPFTGRSDYGPFLEAGIPAGGLFTGAEEVKSMALRTKFGGLALAAYDPCYHQACDTIENINVEVLGEMSRGAAYVLEELAGVENLPTYLQTIPPNANYTV